MSGKHPGARPRGAGLYLAYDSARAALRALVETKMTSLLPLALVLLGLALLLALCALVSPIAPFVYPLF